jgi:hypothetical protein
MANTSFDMSVDDDEIINFTRSSDCSDCNEDDIMDCDDSNSNDSDSQCSEDYNQDYYEDSNGWFDDYSDEEDDTDEE